MQQSKKAPLRFVFTWHDFGVFISLLVVATILCYFLRKIDDSDVYVALIFELTVVLVSRFTDGYLFGLLSSVVGVIGINYIFTFPYYQLNFTISGYPLTFLVMLIVSVVVSTLTTQIKQQEKIRAEAEKEKMRGNLLRAVSHDIRTPLTSIVGGVSTHARFRRPADARGDKNAAAGQISATESQLARRRGGKPAFGHAHRRASRRRSKRSWRPGEEVLSAASREVPQALSRRSTVSVRAPEELLMIPMDAILIEQVLINLMENAIAARRLHDPRGAASPPRGRFARDLRGRGRRTRASRRDVLPLLFTGAVSSSARRGLTPDGKRNMGIGLSVCMTIVQAHGGTMAGGKPGALGGALFQLYTATGGAYHDDDPGQDSDN